ncbi:MAG: BamA/TamA family outer membrane protein, partial [Bdellovibrionia bacterium]
GRSTVRGFDQLQESIPSRDEFRYKLWERDPTLVSGGPKTSNAPLYVTGHSTFYLLKTELRFPIAGDLGGVIFYDGGAVLISDVTFADPYRDSAGVGLRYETPVGPVSFEAAWKLNRRDIVFAPGTPEEKRVEESPFRFHFSIGMF